MTIKLLALDAQGTDGNDPSRMAGLYSVNGVQIRIPLKALSGKGAANAPEQLSPADVDLLYATAFPGIIKGSKADSFLRDQGPNLKATLEAINVALQGPPNLQNIMDQLRLLVPIVIEMEERVALAQAHPETPVLPGL